MIGLVFLGRGLISGYVRWGLGFGKYSEGSSLFKSGMGDVYKMFVWGFLG